MHWMLLPLKRYAEFSGRSRRKEYWMFVLGMVLFYTVLVILMVALMGGAILNAAGGLDADGAAAGAGAGAGMMGAMLGGGIIGIVILLSWLLLLIPSIAVGVRRLHDIDRTGWWLMLGYGPYILSMILMMSGSVELAAILNLVSLVGFIVLLVFAVMPGTRGPNRFGPDPKGEDLGQVFA
ncbi:MAG TPA: DUF805 domain-containing protein [Allosphingosinicella sp.]